MTVAHSSSRKMQQVRKALFVPCPRCLSTGVKGFAQPKRICQLPLQPASSQSELPGSASKRLNLRCPATLGNISLHLKDLIVPSLAPQKSGCLRDPGKQGYICPSPACRLLPRNCRQAILLSLQSPFCLSRNK